MISSFRLSDPGSLQAIDPSILEYLRSYRLPLPPAARYGFSRFASPQEKYQVLLHSQAWVPSHANGTVLLLHGYSEHSANYARLIRDLVEAQLAVITLDFRGHGLSEGPSGHVPFSHTYAEDAETVLGQIFPATLPNRPLFVFGHSMGAMIAGIYAGVRPARIARLSLVEGFGLNATRPAEAPGRYARWLREGAHA